MIKVSGKNFVVIENPVGILTKICDCGWASCEFMGLTSKKCPKCKVIFEVNNKRERKSQQPATGENYDRRRKEFEG